MVTRCQSFKAANIGINGHKNVVLRTPDELFDFQASPWNEMNEQGDEYKAH